MGNQESIPCNNTHIVKKKKVLKVPQNRIQQRERDDQQRNDRQMDDRQRSDRQRNDRQRSERQRDNRQSDDQYQQDNSIKQRNNIIPIKNNQEFSNYNYEIKEKNTNVNAALVNRNLLTVSQNNTEEKFISYPSSSNDAISLPKPNFDDIKFNPYNFNDKVEDIQTSLEEEKVSFKLHQEQEKINFDEKLNKKTDYVNEKIKMFEKDYNPWEILGIESNNYNIINIKKAYKKRALKYHPDKNIGNKDTSDLFNLITNAYIYLLKKAEEFNENEIKINKDVVDSLYEDDINDNVHNVHLDKDNFSIDKFNKIFDEYRVDDESEQGYSDLMKNENDNKDESKIFNSKVSQDVFNAHFNKIKQNKGSEQLIQFQEPAAMDSSSNFSIEQLGNTNDNGYGFSNNNNLSYTDIKSAHFDENLLIDPNSVKYKTYNSVEQLESSRSNINFNANEKERDYYKQVALKDEEHEKTRQVKMKEKDNIIYNNFNKINRKLIIHKK